MAKGLYSLTRFAALSVLSLLPLHLELAAAARQSSHATMVDIGEHDAMSASAPKVIYLALMNASTLVNTQMEELEAASDEAEQRKKVAQDMIGKKLAIIKDVKDKTAGIAKKAHAAQAAMVEVQKATTEHTNAGKAHAESVANFAKISNDLEGLQNNITRKEEAMRQILRTLKRDIEALKNQLAAMSKEKDAAGEKAKDLNLQAAKKGQFKKGAQQEQVKAQNAVEQAQKELREMHAQLDVAVSAATAAEAKETEASDLATAAGMRVDQAKKTKQLLLKIKKAVKLYYDSVEELEEKVEMESKAHHEMKKLPEARTALEKYNLMIDAFRDLHAHDSAVYKKVTPAVEEVRGNANTHIRYICDIKKKISDKEAEEHCLSGLWKKLNMTQLELPSE